MRRVVAVGLLASMLTPSLAWAGDDGYPRFIERGDQVCVQTQLSDGSIAENCRSADRQAAPVTNYKVPPTPRYFDDRPSRRLSPTLAAAADASEISGGGAFAGGMLAGFTLGLIGTAVAGVVANSSSVVPPPSPPGYSEVEKWQYHHTYVNEVQGTRTTNAVVGGLIGTGLAVITIILIVQATD